MKKKIISILLVASLMAGNMGDLSGMQVKAAPAYTYEPVTGLYMAYESGNHPATGDSQIALMDQSMSMAASDGTFLTTYKDYDSQRAYLERNHYLLNSYFTLESDGGGSTFRYQGDQILGSSVKGTKKGTYAAGYAAGNGMTGMVREGSRVHTFDPSREWYYATLKRDGISVGAEEYDKDTIWNGNTVNMVAKGDVEYSYALEGYSDEITKMDGFAGLYGHKYVFRGLINALGKGADVDSLGRFKKFNLKTDGSLMFSSLSDYWSSAKKLQNGGMWFKGYGNDSTVSPVRFQKITVYGKDTQGPKIAYAAVYDRNPVYQKEDTIPEGKAEGFMNWELAPVTGVSEAGKELYVALVFDEPVVFKEGTVLSDLKLDVKAMGISGSDANPAAASFYSYAPHEKTGLPVMVFKYTVPTDSSVRGDYYRLTKVVFNNQDNAALFQNITDLSGNVMGLNQSGMQDGFEKNLVNTVIDLRKLAVKSVSMDAGDAANVPEGGKLSVTVNLTKEISNRKELEKAEENLPVLTLNVKDQDGNYVTIGGTRRVVNSKSESFLNYEITDTSDTANSASCLALRFTTQTEKGWQLEEGADRIRVKSLHLNGLEIKDEVGNVLSGEIIQNGKTQDGTDLTPDRSYQLDYQPMKLTLEAGSFDDTTNIYKVPYQVNDNASLKGCTGKLSFYLTPSYYGEEKLQYAVLDTDTVADSEWKAASDGTGAETLIFSDAKEQKGYFFLKLPDKCEAGDLNLKLEGSDGAGNEAQSIQVVKIGIDRAEPRVKMEWLNERTIRVAITDLSDVSWSYDWKVTKKSGSADPVETHKEDQGTDKVITLKNDEIGTEQALYESVFTLSVTASGPTVTMPELTGSYDNTAASIELSSDVPTDQFVSGSPWVTVDYTDVAKLEYCWLARSMDDPAGNFFKGSLSFTEIDLNDKDTSTQSLLDEAEEKAVVEEVVEEPPAEAVQEPAGEELKPEEPADDPAEGLPVQEKPKDDSEAEGPAEEKSSGSEPAGEEPTEEKPAENESTEEPLEEKPNGENSSGSEPAKEETPEEKPTEGESTGKSTDSEQPEESAEGQADASAEESVEETPEIKTETGGQFMTMSARHAVKTARSTGGHFSLLAANTGDTLTPAAESDAAASEDEAITLHTGSVTLNAADAAELWLKGNVQKEVSEIYRPLELFVKATDASGKSTYKSISFRLLNRLNTSGEELVSGNSYTFIDSNFRVWDVDVTGLDGLSKGQYAKEEDLLVTGKIIVGKAYDGAEIDYANSYVKVTDEETGEELWRETIDESTLVKDNFDDELASWEGLQTETGRLQRCTHYRYTTVIPASVFENVENRSRGFTVTLELVPYTPKAIEGTEQISFDERGRTSSAYMTVVPKLPITGGIAGIKTWQGTSGDGSGEYKVTRDLHFAGTQAQLSVDENGTIEDHTTEQVVELATLADLTGRQGIPQLVFYAQDGGVNEDSEDTGRYKGRTAQVITGSRSALKLDTESGTFVIDENVGTASYGELKNRYEDPYSIGIWPEQATEGHAGYENALLGESYRLQLQSGLNEIYYQFISASGDYSPVYKLSLQLKKPQVTSEMNPPAPTDDSKVSQEVTVDIHINEEEDLAKVDVTAAYEGGEAVPQLSGSAEGTHSFLFARNGNVTVSFTDKEGNTSSETIPVTHISEAPVLEEVKSNSTTQIDVTGKTGTNAVRVGFRFDEAYEKCIDADGNDDGQWHDVKEGTFPGRLDGTTFNDDGTFRILAEAKSIENGEGVNPTSITIRAEDRYGHVTEQTLALSVTGSRAKAVTTSYTCGESFGFNQPIYLAEPDTGVDKWTYKASYDFLPVYESGTFTITYYDLFARQWTEEITAVLDDAFRHSVVQSITTSTKEDVTVTISALADHLYVKCDDDVKADGDTVSIGESTYGKTGKLTYTESDIKAYTLAVLSEDRTAEERTMTFQYRVGNIDRTAPTAVWERVVNGNEVVALQEDGSVKRTVYGSVTYQILGFDEENVRITDSSNGVIRFTAPGKEVFHFQDEAGNRGTLEVSEQDTDFISTEAGTIKEVLISWYLGDILAGTYVNPDGQEVDFPKTTKNMRAVLTALNEKGETVDTELSLAEGTEVDFAKINQTNGSVVFSGNGSLTLTLKAANEVQIPLTISNIDKRVPTGRLIYGQPENGTVKVYVEHDADSWIEEPQNVQTDAEGEYIEFTSNGMIQITLKNDVGNITTLIAEVYVLDTEPPVITSSRWLTQTGDLTKVTNGAVRLYMEFNEQISRAELTISDSENNQVGDAQKDAYAKATVLGNTLTVDFEQNCQIGLKAYDMSGNAPQTPWTYPADAPLTIIDRIAPTMTLTKTYDGDTNTVHLAAYFDEPVTGTFEAGTGTDGKPVYENHFEKTVDKNGTCQLSFADEAGNPVSQVVQVTEIDTTAPKLTFTFCEQDGNKLELKTDKQGNLFAPVRKDGFYLQVTTDEDNTSVGIRNTSTRGMEQKLGITGRGQYVNYLVEENGIYQLIAEDRYGNTGVSTVTIDFLDKTPPALTLPSGAVEVLAGTQAAVAKAALRSGVTADEACDMEVLLDESILRTAGFYVVPIQAVDKAGNETRKTRRLKVLPADGHYFMVNGRNVQAGSVSTVTGTTVTVKAPEEYTEELSAGGEAALYWSKGYQTRAQMKDAKKFTDSFEVSESGYYTVMLGTPNRDAYLIYLYVQ